jgi:imidazole glycerol-phosphate synthase subunit HisH
MARTVALVDYGMGNLDSVSRALEECGASVRVTDQAADVEAADRVVLPGVGSFGQAMENLRERDLDKALARLVVDEGMPFLGICLGMQLMADAGSEGADGGVVDGLGWIRATVPRLVPTAADPRVPHVGWNELEPVPGCPLFAEVEPGTDVYFVHSYHVVCADPADVAATTPYCGGFTSAVQRGTMFGVQFHPEKSQRAGFAVLRGFLAA